MSAVYVVYGSAGAIDRKFWIKLATRFGEKGLRFRLKSDDAWAPVTEHSCPPKYASCFVSASHLKGQPSVFLKIKRRQAHEELAPERWPNVAATKLEARYKVLSVDGTNREFRDRFAHTTAEILDGLLYDESTHQLRTRDHKNSWTPGQTPRPGFSEEELIVRRDSTFAESLLRGAPSFELELEEPSLARSPVDEDAIEAYYRDHVPPGGPPLETIRDHVIAALQRASGPAEPDLLTEQAAALDLRFLATMEDELDWAPRELEQGLHLSAEERSSRLTALHDALPADWSPRLLHQARETLLAAADLTAAAAEKGRKSRLVRVDSPLSDQEIFTVLRRAKLGSSSQVSDLLASLADLDRDGIPPEPWADHFEAALVLGMTFASRRLSKWYADDYEPADLVVPAKLSELCGEDLPITSLRGQLSGQKGFISFRIDGKSRKWTLKSPDDFDPEIAERLGRLMPDRGSRRLLYRMPSREIGDSSDMYLCLSRGQYSELRAGGAPVFLVA